MSHPHAPVAQTNNTSTAQLVWLLIGDVADIVDDGLDIESLRWLAPVLEVLRKEMTKAEQRDARDGYLSDVTDISPNWYDQVEALRSLRVELCIELTGVIGRVRQTSGAQSPDEPLDPFVARALSAQLTSWVDRMTTHHRAERELCQSVWYTELGVGD